MLEPGLGRRKHQREAAYRVERLGTACKRAGAAIEPELGGDLGIREGPEDFGDESSNHELLSCRNGVHVD